MLLSADRQDEINKTYAEQILTDISAAFGHSFSLMQEKIGPKAEAAWGEAVPDRVIRACRECQGVFVGDCLCGGMQELYDALNMPLWVRSLSVPEAACGRHEAPVALWVGTALSLDDETLRQAVQEAFFLSQEEDMRLCSIAPAGASREAWDAAVRVQESLLPKASAVSLSAPQAVSAMITSPERAGLLLCPPYAGGILLAAGTALCGHPEMIHDLAFDGSFGVFSAFLPPNEQEPAPFSAALAVAKLLRYSLRMQKEAACVEAAVKNVLSAGWQAEGGSRGPLSGQGMLDLVCEQITVAGELMRRSGIGS